MLERTYVNEALAEAAKNNLAKVFKYLRDKGASDAWWYM